MNRRAAALIVPLALLSACGGGGGGGKGGSLPPVSNTPQKKIGTATFSFRIPSKNTMTKLKRRFYQSQATQGVAIDWNSSDPTHPDYLAPISATCAAPASLPPGVASCTVDANGDTDYTFQLQIPAGTYANFNVTTFDAPPSGGTFSANMLAQGQLAAPVVIVAGQANAIPNLTFYGIPAAVSFVPGPAQSHVVMFSGSISVIGNAPQTFFAQAVDADGFVIDSTDGGAPTVTVAETASDSPQEFAVATTATPYEYTLTARNAIANATIDLTATPGGTGLSPVINKVTVAPIPEMWISSTNDGSGEIYGYALNANSTYPFQPGAIVDTVGIGSYTPYAIAVDNNGNLWVTDGNGTIYLYSAGIGSTPPAQTSTTITGGLQQVVGLAVDANNTLWVADQQAPDSNGEVVAYNISNPSSPAPIANDTIRGSTHATMANPQALGVAPNTTSLPPSARNTVWVASRSSLGTVDMLTPGSGSTPIADTYPAISTGLSTIGAIAIGNNGTVWLSDEDTESNTFGYSFSPPALTQTITSDMGQNDATGLATDPTGALWVAYNNYTLNYVGTNGSQNGSLSLINGLNAFYVCIVP